MNLLHNINKEENENYFNCDNRNIVANINNLISSINPLNKRNNNRKNNINFSKTIYKFKNQSPFVFI